VERASARHAGNRAGIRAAGGLLLLLAASAAAQSFDVASIRVKTKAAGIAEMSSSYVRIAGPGHVQASNANLFECLQWAYGDLRDDQISGPAWLKDNRPSFFIEAKAPPETPAPELRRMLRTLLAERFQVKARVESRMEPVFELTVAKNGPKLPPVKPNAPQGVEFRRGQLLSGSVTPTRLARALARELGRPVFDKTGIQTPFSFDLQFASEDEPRRPSLTTAVEQTLGLKLTRTRGPVEHLIVDSAQRLPSEN